MQDNEERLEAEGTYTKCRCGRYFYLSFFNGFLCDSCKAITFKKDAERLNEFFKSKRFREMQAEYRETRASKYTSKKKDKRSKE